MTDEVQQPQPEAPVSANPAVEQAPARASGLDSKAWKRRDLTAKMLRFMVHRRSRLPHWQEDAITVVAAAEARGVRLLEAALPAIADAPLRSQMLRHIEDEKRHANTFTRFSNELNPGTSVPVDDSAVGSTHVLGFFAFLEISELRAGQMIENYRDLYCDYPEIQEFMDTAIRDEQFHAGYVHSQLDAWVAEGLGKEVAAARRAAAKIDSQGFRIQLRRFIRTIPRMIWFSIQSRA